MALEWRDEYNIAVPEIDQQHRDLFTHLNNLMQAMQRGTSKQAAEEMLGFLGNYVVEHFGSEERLMAAHAYPGSEAHKREHAGFIKTFLELKESFLSTGSTFSLSIALNGIVGSWLIKHILGTDQALGLFLRSRK